MWRGSEINKYIKEVRQSWLLARILPRYTVNKIKNHVETLGINSFRNSGDVTKSHEDIFGQVEDMLLILKTRHEHCYNLL